LYRSVFCTADAKGYYDKCSEHHSTTLHFYVRVLHNSKTYSCAVCLRTGVCLSDKIPVKETLQLFHTAVITKKLYYYQENSLHFNSVSGLIPGLLGERPWHTPDSSCSLWCRQFPDVCNVCVQGSNV